MVLPPPPLFESVALNRVSERLIPTLPRKRLVGSSGGPDTSGEKTLIKSEIFSNQTSLTVVVVWAFAERVHYNYVRRAQVNPLNQFDDTGRIVPIGSVITLYSFRLLSSVSNISEYIGLISAFTSILALSLRFGTKLKRGELSVFCFM